MSKLLHFLYLLLLASTFFSCDCNRAINRHPYEFQPDIAVGGRIVNLDRSPSKESDILAAAESGGLFITRKYGKSWEHLNLPVFELNDAKFSHTDPNVFIVTCSRDLKINNGGGIWRTSDGGKSWIKPPTSVPTGFGTKRESHGFAISIEPGTPNIFVGTENGLAISHDNGVTWTFNSISGFMFGPQTVYSVISPGGGMILVTTKGGVYKSTDGGSTFKKTFSNNNLKLTRGLCTSPVNKQNVFLASEDYKLYYSSDFGSNWREINSPGGQNREPFISCTIFPTVFFGQTVNVASLYYGNGVNLYRKILPNAERGDIDFGNEWFTTTLDHSDPSDIVYGDDGKPILLSGDGGVFSCDNSGNIFTFTGGGDHGLNALQINEVTAQTNFDDKKRDYIYFGTQDNYFWYSEDAGKAWNGWGNEGHSIEVRRQAIGKKGNLMTVSDNGAGKVFSFDYGFQNQQDWKHPTPKPVDDPVIYYEEDVLEPNPMNRFVELTNAATDTVPLTNFYITNDGGQNWTFKGSMNFNASSGNPQVNKLSGSTTVYQAISTGTTTSQGYGKIGLVKLINVLNAGTGTLQRADNNGFGSIGIFPTMFKWYNVFGVDPKNANHVIIADIENSKVKVTWDGGMNWFDDDEITELVTSFGKYKFYDEIDGGPRIMVTCISYNPDNPAEIVIGTRENGLFMSWDKGETWFPLNDTWRITNASKIFFYFDNTLLVSTYGRGLWKFQPVRGEKPQRSAGNSIKGAYILDVIKHSGKRLEDNFSFEGINENSRIILFNDTAYNISPETLFANRTERLSIRNAGLWKLNKEFIADTNQIDIRLPQEFYGERTQFHQTRIRGVIISPDNSAAAFILCNSPYKLYSADQLSVKKLTEPYIEMQNRDGAYTYYIQRSESYILKGYNFTTSPKGNTVRILFNDSLISNVPVSEQGVFQFQILPSQIPYEKFLKITVEGYYNKEIIRRTLNVQISLEGERFEKKLSEK